MKYFSLFVLPLFLFLSCSSVDSAENDPDPDSDVLTQIKRMSSCDEVHALASDIIHGRALDEDNSYASSDQDPKFSCRWTETWAPDNPDVFVGMTTVYSVHEVAEVSRDYLLDREGFAEVKDERLNASRYSNVLIMKSYSEVTSSRYYSLNVWGESKRVSRVIAEDLAWAEEPSPQLSDAAIVDMFLGMLESVD